MDNEDEDEREVVPTSDTPEAEALDAMESS